MPEESSKSSIERWANYGLGDLLREIHAYERIVYNKNKSEEAKADGRKHLDAMYEALNLKERDIITRRTVGKLEIRVRKS